MITLLDNLEFYYPMDEASGVRRDIHKGYTLTDNNTCGSRTGVVRTAADFIRANDESLSYDPAFTIGDVDFTIAMWFQIDQTGVQHTLWEARNAARTVGPLIYISNAEVLNWRIYGGGSSSALTRSISGSTLYFLVCQYRASDNVLQWSLNGDALSGTANRANGATTDGYVFGRSWLGDDLTGMMDEVGFWFRLLTQREIEKLYNSGKGLQYPFYRSLRYRGIDRQRRNREPMSLLNI